MEKEKKLYAKISKLKDEDTDSQHIWAQKKIRLMYKCTKMEFNGGLTRKRDNNMTNKEKSPDSKSSTTI